MMSFSRKLGVPRSMLPTVIHPVRFGETDASSWCPHQKWLAMLATAGCDLWQACFEVVMAKESYGTGCFMLMTRKQRCSFADGLLTIRLGMGDPASHN